MVTRAVLLLALPALAMAFGPTMPLASTPALSRHCRAATPVLRMTVKDIGSEKELDDAIANAGVKPAHSTMTHV
jgi:hypothetical protein